MPWVCTSPVLGSFFHPSRAREQAVPRAATARERLLQIAPLPVILRSAATKDLHFRIRNLESGIASGSPPHTVCAVGLFFACSWFVLPSEPRPRGSGVCGAPPLRVIPRSAARLRFGFPTRRPLQRLQQALRVARRAQQMRGLHQPAQLLGRNQGHVLRAPPPDHDYLPVIGGLVQHRRQPFPQARIGRLHSHVLSLQNQEYGIPVRVQPVARPIAPPRFAGSFVFQSV